MHPPLSHDQIKSWHTNGYLILENILGHEEVDRLRNAVEDIVELHERESVKEKNTSCIHGKDYYNIHNPLEYTDAFDYLIDHPRLFDTVTFLMGPFIEAMSLHIFVRHPSSAKNSNIGKFHTDSGPVLQQILPTPENLPLQLKFQFFLTDITTENASNFTVVPGSHLRRVREYNPFCLVSECNSFLERGEMPPDAVQLKVKAGDVLIHALTVWHAVAPNLSQISRKSISVRYGQMWFKNYYSHISTAILERMTPRRRRLLGDYGTAKKGDYAYRPPEDQLELILGEKSKKFGWEATVLSGSLL
ncbi:MAG: phytanoyl-CoA dioxygenase family protein [Chlamydiales bacterium]|nr:phytanoyl-CoA dioxygenase family protein [Chlamydiales bacterium]